MAKTVQEIIEEAREREELFKTAKKGIREESIERFKSLIKKPTPVSPSVRRVERKVGARVRKAVHLLAPEGMVRRITAPSKKKVSGRGRGRPRETYKTRVLPSGKVVKVPTHIYKKMLKQEKATMRLAQAQRQAILQQQAQQATQQAAQQAAEEVAIQQDPRFQLSQEDAWADSEDMEHLEDVQRIKQQQLLRQQMSLQEHIQRPSVLRRAGEMFGKARITLMGGQQAAQQAAQQPQYPEQYPQRPAVLPLQRPQIAPIHRPVDPKVTILGGKSPMFGNRDNIMTQRNELF